MGAHVAPLFTDHLGQRLRLKPGLWPLRTASPSSHSAFIVELSSLSLLKKKKNWSVFSGFEYADSVEEELPARLKCDCFVV